MSVLRPCLPWTACNDVVAMVVQMLCIDTETKTFDKNQKNVTNTQPEYALHARRLQYGYAYEEDRVSMCIHGSSTIHGVWHGSQAA